MDFYHQYLSISTKAKTKTFEQRLIVGCMECLLCHHNGGFTSRILYHTNPQGFIFYSTEVSEAFAESLGLNVFFISMFKAKRQLNRPTPSDTEREAQGMFFSLFIFSPSKCKGLAKSPGFALTGNKPC